MSPGRWVATGGAPQDPGASAGNGVGREIDEPDGRAFGPINPGRRIVRARRPPNAGAQQRVRQAMNDSINARASDGSGNGTGIMRRPDADDYDEDEEEDYRAEDSDDEGPMGPPSRFFQGFLHHMSEMARRSANRRPGQNLSTKIRPDDDAEESDEDQEDNDAVCAACFRSDNQAHKWRRLVTLPCCGTNGREANSSTRFCAACILKVAVTRPHSSNTSEYHLADDEPDSYPVKKFYRKNLQRDSRRFCECPRCRDILLVKIKGIKLALSAESDDDSSECDCDCEDCEAERRERRAERGDAKTAKSISLHVPSFKAKCWYIGRKRGVAKLLWRVSLLHHNFMPFEALGGDEDKAMIERLAGSWGIIERSGKVYRIDKEDQRKLCKFFRLDDPSEADKKSECNLLYEINACVFYAAWRHLRDEFRIDRSLRMMNRFLLLMLHFNGQLPPLPLSGPQELIVTALNLFLVALLLQFACVFAVYALAFFGVGLSVCFALRRTNNIKDFWWQATLISYVIYRGVSFFYQNPYLKWSVMIAPKAMIPVKALFWDSVAFISRLWG